jgi:hypothetical protein
MILAPTHSHRAVTGFMVIMNDRRIWHDRQIQVVRSSWPQLPIFTVWLGPLLARPCRHPIGKARRQLIAKRPKSQTRAVSGDQPLSNGLGSG